MADPLRLSLHDHVLIHGLAVISRPEMMATHRDDLEMIVSMMRDVLPGAGRGTDRLQPLISVGRGLVAMTPIRPGFYGSFHDEARRAMNRWDRQRMADAWDAVKGASR